MPDYNLICHCTGEDIITKGKPAELHSMTKSWSSHYGKKKVGAVRSPRPEFGLHCSNNSQFNFRPLAGNLFTTPRHSAPIKREIYERKFLFRFLCVKLCRCEGHCMGILVCGVSCTLVSCCHNGIECSPWISALLALTMEPDKKRNHLTCSCLCNSAGKVNRGGRIPNSPVHRCPCRPSSAGQSRFPS